MTDLCTELATHLAMRERLLAAFPELAEDDQALLDTLAGECGLQDAITALILSAENDRTLVAALEIRMDELHHRAERLKERMEKKRQLAADAMSEGGIKKLTLPEATVSLAVGQAKVIVTDEAQIPAHLMVQPEPPAPRPDKKAIAGLLKSGVEVPGCVLSNPGVHIVVRRT